MRGGISPKKSYSTVVLQQSDAYAEVSNILTFMLLESLYTCLALKQIGLHTMHNVYIVCAKLVWHADTLKAVYKHNSPHFKGQYRFVQNKEQYSSPFGKLHTFQWSVHGSPGIVHKKNNCKLGYTEQTFILSTWASLQFNTIHLSISNRVRVMSDRLMYTVGAKYSGNISVPYERILH